MRYAGLKEFDATNGIGISLSFWCQGCPHRCYQCHNPETWDSCGGKLLPQTYVTDILQKIHSSPVPRNLSILGGEPFSPYNLPIISHLIKAFKEEFPDRKVFVWTGYTLERLQENMYSSDILPHIDILIDGEYQDDIKDITLFLRGSANQRVIDMQETLRTNSVVLFNR